AGRTGGETPGIHESGVVQRRREAVVGDERTQLECLRLASRQDRGGGDCERGGGDPRREDAAAPDHPRLALAARVGARSTVDWISTVRPSAAARRTAAAVSRTCR